MNLIIATHKQDLQTNSDDAETRSFDEPAEFLEENFESGTSGRFPERVTKEDIKNLALHAFEGRVHLITEKKDVNDALKILAQETVLGFDTETRPTFKRGVFYSVALLQLSTANDSFLFRLNMIGLPEELAELLANPEVLKVGVAIRDDIKALRKLRVFEAGGFVELADIGKKLGIVTCGLRNLAAIFLKIRISKKAQLTNWERQYLDKNQCLYAATDAWICLEMYHFLERENLLPEDKIWQAPTTASRLSRRPCKFHYKSRRQKRQ